MKITINMPTSSNKIKKKLNVSYGSFGIVVSNPRIPLESETYDKINTSYEVSKLFFDEKSFIDEIEKYSKLKSILDHSMFLFEKSYGLSNINNLIENSQTIYTREWYKCGLNMYEIYSINRYLDYNIFIESSKIYQIVFDCMITLDDLDFNTSNLKEICKENLISIIKFLHDNNLYVDDFKKENIVYNDQTNKFMLIDLTSIVTLQEVIEKKSTWTHNIYSINDHFVIFKLNQNFKIHLYTETDNNDLNYYWDLLTYENINLFKSKYSSDINFMLKYSNTFSLGLTLNKLGCGGFEQIDWCIDIIEQLGN